MRPRRQCETGSIASTHRLPFRSEVLARPERVKLVPAVRAQSNLFFECAGERLGGYLHVGIAVPRVLDQDRLRAGGGDRAVILDAAGSVMTTLNEVGSVIWRELDGERDTATLAVDLAPTFDGVDPETLEADIKEFAARLIDLHHAMLPYYVQMRYLTAAEAEEYPSRKMPLLAPLGSAAGLRWTHPDDVDPSRKLRGDLVTAVVTRRRV